jgi:DNA-binding Xre family transcriptional regulator
MKYEEEWDYTTNRIKEIISEKKWSMARLADEINMDKSNMFRILSANKQRNMQFITLFKIADALGVRMSELVR